MKSSDKGKKAIKAFFTNFKRVIASTITMEYKNDFFLINTGNSFSNASFQEWIKINPIDPINKQPYTYGVWNHNLNKAITLFNSNNHNIDEAASKKLDEYFERIEDLVIKKNINDEVDNFLSILNKLFLNEDKDISIFKHLENEKKAVYVDSSSGVSKLIKAEYEIGTKTAKNVINHNGNRYFYDRIVNNIKIEFYENREFFDRTKTKPSTKPISPGHPWFFLKNNLSTSIALLTITALGIFYVIQRNKKVMEKNKLIKKQHDLKKKRYKSTWGR